MNRVKNRLLMLGVAVLGMTATAGIADEVYIAGTAPSHRPDNAPVITRLVHDAEWYARALTGVEPPYPASLRFLEDQGNWYQPFIRPGMPGPYDLRNWHSQ